MIRNIILIIFINVITFITITSPIGVLAVVDNPGGSSNTPSAINDVFGKINPPDAVKDLGTSSLGISNVLNKFITLIYIGASIITVFFVIISALQWIMSGGDKEAVSKARSRLTYAIIGVVILSLAFIGIKLVGQITGFTFFEGQGITIESGSSGGDNTGGRTNP